MKQMNCKLMILIFVLAATALAAQENRSKVGIWPWPRDSVHEMTGSGRVASWKPGIGNYDAMLKADDYKAFPHGCGSQRPVGPESDPYSYLGFARWLIQELENGGN
jgi:hypothetical protein